MTTRTRSTTRTASRALWLLALIVVVVTALVVVLDRVGDDRPRARAGEVFTDLYVEEDAFADRPATDVALPVGHYDLWVDAPSETIRVFDDRDPTFAPPEGGSFVSVYLRPDRERLLRYVATSTLSPAAPTVELLAGDRRFPLAQAGRDIVALPALRVYAVAIHAAADEVGRDDLSLAITWDGVTQVVDLGVDADGADDVVDAGRATPLYDAPTVASDDFSSQDEGASSCGTPRWRGGFAPIAGYARPGCQVTGQLRVPYVGGIGWAEPGAEFLAVYVTRDELGFATDTRTGADYQARDAEVRFTLDGEPSLRTLKVNDLAGPFTIRSVDDPYQALFSVPTGSAGSGPHVLGVRENYVGRTTEPGVELAPTIRIDWRGALADTGEGAS